MYCHKCGEKVLDDALFCSNCGAKLPTDLEKSNVSEKPKAKPSRTGFLRQLETSYPMEKNGLFLGITDLEAYLRRKKYIRKTVMDLKDVHDVELVIDILNARTGFLGINKKRNARYARTLEHFRQYLLSSMPTEIVDDNNGTGRVDPFSEEKISSDYPEESYSRAFPDANPTPDSRSSDVRDYTTPEANMLLAEHCRLRESLYAINEANQVFPEEIKKTSEVLRKREVRDILDEIPIEEINRNKSGFRIKALKDMGYHTIGDIANEPAFVIGSIYGISEYSANAIHRIVKDIVSTTNDKTKIRLNADKRSPEASALVQAISKQKAAQALLQECQEQLKFYEERIAPSMKDLRPATSGIAWAFTGKRRKSKANEAYRFLRDELNGTYASIAKKQSKRFDEISKIKVPDAWEDFIRDPVRFTKILEDVNPEVLGNDDTIYGLPEDLAREVQEECLFPDGLLCELRRYQEWGVKYILHQGKVLLGDEMGLGKTVQAIAAMVSLRNTGASHFVVVCPASVITNWCREIQKMSRLSVIKVHGSGRKAALLSWIQNGGVAVTTYETTSFFKLPENYEFAMMVVDEAHYIKNEGAQRTVNVKKIGEHAQRLLFMTGTALENKVEEMVALIQMLRPDIAQEIESMTYLSAAPEFRQAVAPVYYRRKREDVLTELPELIENKEWCTLGAQEEGIYENAVLAKNYMEARRVSWNVDDPRYSSKARRMMELIEEASGDGRKVIVFSFFLDTIKKVITLLGQRCLQPINGSVTPQRRQDIIDQFETAPAGTVLAAQIQSGGTGLNIQSASVVIICEPQFKPSIENQAISRAYRMGQTRNVLVYRLLCENTVDEKIMELLESKQELFDAFADKSVAAAESLNIDDRTFGNIIQEEIERINEKKQASNSQPD